MYSLDDSGMESVSPAPPVGGLTQDAQDGEGSEVSADPLGWGLGCVEACKCGSDTSSEGTRAEKRERVDGLGRSLRGGALSERSPDSF